MKIMNNKAISEKRIIDVTGITDVEIPFIILSTTNKKDKTAIILIVEEKDNFDII